MTKTKSTKRALLSSVLALVMCVSMLIGSTFAWFTDSVTSSGNKIVAGTLDVQLLMDADVDGNYDDISNSASPIFGSSSLIAQNNNADTLWEPGKTQVAYLAIKNNGNLALKYTVGLNVTNESKDLYEVMEYAIVPDADANNKVTSWTSGNSVIVGTQSVSGDVSLAAGATHYFALVIHMDEAAGNEYQGGEVNFDITIMATQDTVEEDSFDSQYDKDAMYAVADGLYIDEEDGSYVALSTEGLSSIAMLASTDSSITSVTYVTDEGEVEVPVVRSTADMNTELAEGEDTIVLTEGTYTVGAAAGKTVTLVGNEDTKVDVTSGLTYVRGANVTFEGLTIQSAPEGAGYTNGLADATYSVFNNCVIDGTLGLDYSCEFNNCEFNIEGNYYNVWTWGAGKATFNGCTFNCDGKALLVYANVLDNGTNHQTVNITNCVFNDNGDDNVTGKAAIEITNTYHPVRTYDVFITNTEVNGFSQTVPGSGDFNATYGSVEGSDIGTNVWGNKMKLSNTQINIVIDGVDVY